LLVFNPDEQRLADAFERFHRENPQVYTTLVQLARRWRERHPVRPCGIKMLFEVARWTLSLRTGGEPLLLNNNYHAFYARLIMDREPDLADLFHLRRQRFDWEPTA